MWGLSEYWKYVWGQDPTADPDNRRPLHTALDSSDANHLTALALTSTDQIGTDGNEHHSLDVNIPAGITVSNLAIGNVVVSSSALPAGAATSALQTTGNSSLAALAGAVSSGILQVALDQTPFVTDSNNSSVAQLAAAASFTGAVTNINNQPSLAYTAYSDQPGTLVVTQYADAAGTQVVQQNTFYNIANNGINGDLPVASVYYNVKYTNNGAALTTKFSLSCGLGYMFPSTNEGNVPVQHRAGASGGANAIWLRNLGATVNYVKASAGTLYSLNVSNGGATGAWVQVFNAASGVVLGTTAPIAEMYIPASSSNIALILPDCGVAMNAGIALSATTLENGTVTAVTGLIANVVYF